MLQEQDGKTRKVLLVSLVQRIKSTLSNAKPSVPFNSLPVGAKCSFPYKLPQFATFSGIEMRRSIVVIVKDPVDGKTRGLVLGYRTLSREHLLANSGPLYFVNMDARQVAYQGQADAGTMNAISIRLRSDCTRIVQISADTTRTNISAPKRYVVCDVTRNCAYHSKESKDSDSTRSEGLQ